MNKYKYHIVGLFCIILFASLLYFCNQGAYSHKIKSGTIKAKVTLPARTEMRGKIVHVVPETFIFMVQKDSITEKFEIDKKTYEAAKVGDFFKTEIE